MLASVLVANRGEIAVRIIRTLRALGVRSVAVYSDADAGARHVGDADEAFRLGPAPASESYLDIDRVLDAARRSGAEAIHPGYGFLSENPELAARCVAAGITWIGPPPAAIALMGDKINAKRAAADAGVAVVPGCDGDGLDDDQLAAAARRLGLPVLVKPSTGGGGKGMRRVDDPAQLGEAIAAARREALAAFGDATLLVERFVARPRHVEVQVFADTHGGVIHLGERECSLQRRHQKIVEESPSPLLDRDSRSAMGASAVAVARACGYVGAGTVEFIVSGDRPGVYFFLEMNTRLQVEHAVTELVTGTDLVEWQLLVAAGEALPLTQEQVAYRGHAMEARVYAEDPDRGFLPVTGRILAAVEPAGPHLRVDSGLGVGTEVGPYYDPMLAKVVAWGRDREEARTRLDRALAATALLGVTTNVAFLRRLLAHPDVVAGNLDTELVERSGAELTGTGAPDEVAVAAALLSLRRSGPDPWDQPGGWRIGGPASVEVELRVAGVARTVAVTGPPAAAQVRLDSGAVLDASLAVHGGNLAFTLAGHRRRMSWAPDGDGWWIGLDGGAWKVVPDRARIPAHAERAGGAGPVTSPMPGTVLRVHVVSGEQVRAGQALVTVEAMKMEHTVRSALDGVVAEVAVHAGQRVGLEQLLAVVSAPVGGPR
ncbi:MAG: acetyl/propionyl/methylcrotonyl-CoA carboxylase subunit alpha [Acidimicrobiales bacterium]